MENLRTVSVDERAKKELIGLADYLMGREV